MKEHQEESKNTVIKDEESLSLFNKFRKADWWVQIQFFVLIISIIANLFLWFRNEDLNKKIQRSTYLDLAYVSISLFEEKRDALNQKTIENLENLSVKLVNRDEYKKAVQIEHKKWFEEYADLITEMASKIKSYEAIVVTSLKPFSVAEEKVNKIQSPFRFILDTLSARINERKFLLQKIIRENPSVTMDRGPGYIAHGTRQWEEIYKSLEIEFLNGISSLQKLWHDVRY